MNTPKNTKASRGKIESGKDKTASTEKQSTSSRPAGKYYIRQSHRTDDPKDPVQKPAADLFYILENSGYHSLGGTTLNKAFGKVMVIFLLLVKSIFFVQRGSTLVFNLPANYRLMMVIHLIKRVKRLKLIVHCFDIPSVRYAQPMRLSREDRDMMNWCDVVLTPSVNTESILRPLGLTAPCIPVEVWDYIYPNDVTCREGDGRVAFAGNPTKAAFLSQLGELSTRFTLWANNYQCDFNNVISLGTGVSPDNLSELAQSSWGLVWDGESVDGSETGPLGNYTRVMTTHKGGLYLAAGLPLIVWARGGMAPFVEKYEVGICVESLRELDTILPTLVHSKYDRYKSNAMTLSHKIRSGHFLHQALCKAERLGSGVS
jgi:hypothetical protein